MHGLNSYNECEEREKSRRYTDRYKEIVNDGIFDGSCSVTLLLAWDLGKFKCLIFVAKCTTVC
jgi:hypothetical protein